MRPIHSLHATKQDPPAFGTPLIKGGRGDQSTLNRCLSVLLSFGVTVTSLSIPAISVANQPQQPSTVERLAGIFRPTRRQGGSRGGSCLLTPGELLWSDRPLFVWDANVGKIEVQTATDRRLVWSQVLASNRQSVVYQGEPLQPEQTYEVILYDPDGKRLTRNEQFYPRFTLVEATKQQQIQADLTQKEEYLLANQATAEAIALEKAVYFSEQQLWSDALQIIYSVPNPSLEVRQFLQEATQNMCGESNVVARP